MKKLSILGTIGLGTVALIGGVAYLGRRHLLNKKAKPALCLFNNDEHLVYDAVASEEIEEIDEAKC